MPIVQWRCRRGLAAFVGCVGGPLTGTLRLQASSYKYEYTFIRTRIRIRNRICIRPPRTL